MTELVLQLSRRLQYLRISKIILFICMLLLLINPNSRDILISSASSAYISVSSFVAITLWFFVFLEKRNFNIQKIISKHKRLEIPIASLLGVIPGCGGAIMVMSMFTKNIVSFGAVLAALISTMGDAAFLLIATKPQAALIILPLTFLGPHLFYQVHTYFPRHIMQGYLFMVISTLYLYTTKKENSVI